MSRFNKYLEEKCGKKKKKKEKINEENLNESYKSAFTEDGNLWKLVKKYWPKETKKLEKDGYDEKTWNDLKDSISGSISRYGFGARIDQSTKKVKSY